MIHPIWRDYYVDLRYVNVQDFRLDMELGQEVKTIYSGRSYWILGTSDPTILLNNICANYVSHQSIPSLSGVGKFDLLPKFIVTSDGIEMDDVQFYPDWSFDETFSPDDRGLSAPILSRVDRRQPLLFTAITDKLVVVAYDENNNSQEKSYSGSGEIGLLTQWISYSHFSQIGKIRKISIAGGNINTEYEIVDSCARYAICYINAYGGWDSLLIEGNHTEVDNITRKTMNVKYNNGAVINRGKKNLSNEINKSMTLHTSWMSDDESLRMHHLLNSPDVYLYDMVKQQMIPVLLKNTTTEYKTYKGNGGKLVNYAIEVEFANDRIRR